ncbi:MAG: putative peptidoglycan glycosyltransferase FtsW [Kiloniellales bacterium]|nr:putative peptidoglycan glycosyltransferase FtsW [Kiloniellales bacterium]
MSSFTRADTSLLGRWWWTIDRWTLFAIGGLMALGIVLMLSASPAAGGRIGLGGFDLAQRQVVFLPIAAALLLSTSLLSARAVRRLAVFGLLAGAVLLVLTLFVGTEIKGASRWLNLYGFSIQPSEFVKPCLAVATAWMFAEAKLDPRFPGNPIAIGLYGLVTSLLLLQPDVGQAFLVLATFGAQLFLIGLPMVWVAGFCLLGVAGLAAAYVLLPHVTVRIDSFLDPNSGDHYQVDRSIEAFMNGGLFGRGPGEGTIKAQLPDVHADFIFAVAGEEFGALVCLGIVALFAFVVLRSLSRLLAERSLFVLLAATGLLVQFGLQALINMGSTLRLMPTKGMTLPFISYGGSSLLALALGMGMLLALTRRRFSPEEGS